MHDLSKDQHLKLYRMISEEAIFGIMVFSLAGDRCLYANRLATELIEISPQADLHTLSLKSLFPAKVRPEFRALSQSLLQNEGLFQDVVILKQNAMTFIANLGVKKIQLEEIECIAIMFQDITVQKKLQRDITAKQVEINAAFEELLKQNQQLKELDLAKNRFIALTTHELRTPLSAMVASAEILKLGLYDNDEQRTEFTLMIYDQGQHLIELVNDILDFAKIQAGKTDLYVEQRDIVKSIVNLTESFVTMGEASEITVKYEPREMTSCLCYFDEIRLRQVFSNMITNAIKYNRQGGEVWVWIEDHAEFVQVFVKDTGRGIAAEDQSKVFNEFETLGKVALHHKGTGLGMPITKRLMEALGGRIDLTSEPGVGSTFWISVPKNKVLPEENYRRRPDDSGDLAA